MKQEAKAMDEAGSTRDVVKPGGVGLSQVLGWVLLAHVVLFGGMYGYHRFFGTGVQGRSASDEEFGPRPEVETVMTADAATNGVLTAIPAGRMEPEEVGALPCEPSGPEVSEMNAGTNLVVDSGADAAAPKVEGGVLPQPGTAAMPPDGREASQGTCVVRGGDSLWKIARRYGVTIAELREANGLATDQIRIGQALRVPAATAKGDSTAAVSPHSEQAAAQYVVAQGDTVFGIARRYGVNADTLAQANRIADPRRVRVGTRLVIPR